MREREEERGEDGKEGGRGEGRSVIWGVSSSRWLGLLEPMYTT